MGPNEAKSLLPQPVEPSTGPAARFEIEALGWRWYEDLEIGHRRRCGAFALSAEEIGVFVRKFGPGLGTGGCASSGDRICACLGHAFAVTIGIFSRANVGCEIIAGIEIGAIDLHAPIAAAAPMTVFVTWIDKRASRSNPNRGLARWLLETVDVDDRPALTTTATVLVRRHRRRGRPD